MKKLTHTLLLVMITSLAYSQAFITTWKTDNPGTSEDNQITIPTNGGGPGFDYSVDWGDGNSDDNVIGDITHSYASPGTYTVSITGDFPSIYFSNSGDKDKILTVEQWGDIEWTTMFRAFHGCSNLNVPATDAPNLTNVTNLGQMFQGASSLDVDLNHWDVSTVTNLYQTFGQTTSFNGNITSWDVSNVTTMLGTFFDTPVFNQPIGSWNVSKVTNMVAIFKESNFNQDISNWDVSKVTNFSQMFRDNPEFNQNIGSWDISMTTDMSFIFEGASAFNQPIGGWDVSKVIDMTSMFEGASVFNADISNWDLIEVLEMNRMFLNAGDFNQDISDWNVSKVADMNDMFNRATSFNSDISGWDVSQVTTMSGMFFRATSFDKNLAAWDVSNVTNMAEMFDESGLSITSYDNTLAGWAVLTLQPNVTFDAANTSFCNGADARQSIIDDFNWSITDAGQTCRPFITTWKTDNAGTSNDNQITIPTVGSVINYLVDWGDGSSDSNVTGNITHTYDNAGTYTVSISGDFPTIKFANGGDEEKLLTIEQWGDIQWKSMFQSFYGCTNLNSDATDEPNLKDVSSLFMTFRECTSFNGDISNWDIGHMISIRDIFLDASSFNRDIGDWDVSNIANMQGVFNEASSFNQDISRWNTSSVTTMNSMFYSASAFNQDIGDWDVSNLENMSNIFYKATNFNQDLSDWETNKVANMDLAFRQTAFNQDISSWNTSAVTTMRFMFQGTANFNQDISDWDIEMVTDMTSMFDGSGLSSFNYDKLLQSWAAQSVQSGVTLGAVGIDYCLGAAARISLLAGPNNWTINDGNENCVIDFPDANFKAALVADATINTTDDGEITVQEAEIVDEINISDADIEDITGIEYFTDLLRLSLGNNAITSVDLSNNLELRNLNLIRNDLTELDLSNNVKLTTINIVDNEVSELDVTMLPLLTQLFTANNNLSELDISQNPDLINLGFQGMGFTSIDISIHTSLRLLYAQENGLTTIDVTNNPALRTLYLGVNNLSEIDLSNNPDISDLRLMENNLVSLDLTNNILLEKLFANDNTLTELNVQNGNNGIITTFDVTDNPNLTCVLVDDINHFTTNFASGIDAEARYSTDCGPIVNIPDVAFKAALLGEASINTVDDGEITVTEAEAFNDLINFQNAGITDLTGLEAFVNVTKLRLSGNAIGSIDLSPFDDLTEISCSNCGLTEIDLSAKPDIFKVSLVNNNIDEIDLSGLPALLTLNMTNTNISTIDFSNNPVLLLFWAGGTNLEEIDVSMLTNFKDMWIEGAPNLQSLNLANGINEDFLRMKLLNNPNLSCVTVDDPAYSEANWKVASASFDVDASIGFSTDCPDPQTISFDPIDDKSTTDSPFEIVASASSGLEVTFTIEGPASLTGTTVTLDGTVGTVTIKANQSGSDDFSPALEEVRSFEVFEAKQDQTITITEIEDKLTTDAAFEVSASASSGLVVTLTINGPATLDGNTVTLNGTVGIVTITANQAGNADFSPAEEASTSFEVIAPEKEEQTLTFNDIEDQFLEEGQITLSATTSSGLTVSYEVVSGPAVVSNDEVTFNDLGTVTIRATQSGDDDFLPAASVERSFDIITVTGYEDQLGSPSVSVYPNPANEFISIDIETNEEISVRLMSLTGVSIMSLTNNLQQIDISHLKKGIYLLKVVLTNQTYTHRIYKN